MKFQDKLIISDMDGTFLSKDALPIEKNLRALRYFIDNGGVFTLATGRCFSVLDFIFPSAKEYVNAPAILCNGGYLFDLQERKFKNPLTVDKNEAIEILSAVEKRFPNIGYRISSASGILIPNRTDYLYNRFNRFDSVSHYRPYTDFLDIDWHKIVFCADKESILQLLEFLSQYKLKQFKYTASSTDLLELIPKESGKGSKVCELKALFPNRTFFGVGDFDNDIDLLQAVDVAACPDNANAAVKQISKVHLCHHEKGCIADLIYKMDSISIK